MRQALDRFVVDSVFDSLLSLACNTIFNDLEWLATTDARGNEVVCVKGQYWEPDNRALHEPYNWFRHASYPADTVWQPTHPRPSLALRLLQIEQFKLLYGDEEW